MILKNQYKLLSKTSHFLEEIIFSKDVKYSDEYNTFFTIGKFSITRFGFQSMLSYGKGLHIADLDPMKVTSQSNKGIFI